MIDPMSSFNVKNILSLSIFNFDISITNSSFFMLLTVLLICFVFYMGTSEKEGLVPNKMNIIIEMAFSFIGDILKTNIGKKESEFFPYIFALFVFILFGNVVGLFPFAFSFTSQIIVTIGLSCIVFFGSIVIGLWNQGWKFFRSFCPKGLPFYLAPFFILIEIMSFFFRPISLGMRLFANMVAGHVMIKVLAGFAVSIASVSMFAIFASVPVVINVFLNLFKFVVCVLQAYVFVVLSCIYLSESVKDSKN